jgi:hypothetical protein
MRNKTAPKPTKASKPNVIAKRSRHRARERNVHQINNNNAAPSPMGIETRLRFWNGQSVCVRTQTMATAATRRMSAAGHQRRRGWGEDELLAASGMMTPVSRRAVAPQAAGGSPKCARQDS